jgi:hypothetical protein
MNNEFRALFDRQVEYLSSKDIDSLIDNNYTEDAELIGFGDLRVVGAEALRPYFREYVDHLGYIRLISVDKYTEGANSIFFEATMETAGGVARVYDVFMLRDGRISHHFTGLLSFVPHAPQG